MSSYRIKQLGKWPKLPEEAQEYPELAWFLAGAYVGWFTHDVEGQVEVFKQLVMTGPDVDQSYMANVAKLVRDYQGEEKWKKMLSIIQATTITEPLSASKS